MVGSIGMLTVIVASIAEKTQSNIKGQVAYASITQVGFMFIELALGLESLVLIHFMGNAFLRCYQLLVSPSIVAHLLRVEGSVDGDFYIKKSNHLQFLPASLRDNLPEVIQNTLYVFALQEGNLDRLVRMILWEPLKKIGARLNAIRSLYKVLGALIVVAIVVYSSLDQGIPGTLTSLPVSVAMVLASLSAFSQKHSPIKVWNSVALSSILAGLGVWLMNSTAWVDVVLFLSGIMPAWLLGLWTLERMLRHEDFEASPFVFRAMAETRPKLSLLLFLSFLGMVGFPISPAFLGEDLLLSHATEQHPWFALPITIAFVLNGIAAARMFLRLCMGRPTEVSYLEEKI
jgi:formate hydrogenlyase subunit 3/multisubunit Na+/H+ antiporter MnhD subunit